MRPEERSRNLASTVLLPVLRVSSAVLPRNDECGRWNLIETWIFSDLPGIKNHQIFHRSEIEAVQVHAAIVASLKKKLLTYDRQVLIDTWLSSAIETGGKWKRRVDDLWLEKQWLTQRDRET